MGSRSQHGTSTDHVHPSHTAPFLANVLLTFVSPLLSRGAGLTDEHLWPLRHDDDATRLTARLQGHWDAECGDAASSGRSPRFATAWARAFLPQFAVVGLAAWAKALFALAQSRFVRVLLASIRDPTQPASIGLWCALMVGVLGAAAAVSDAWFWRQTWFHGKRWAVATQGVLYAKGTRVRVDALGGVTTGYVLSLASSDVERFLQVVHHMPHLVLAPIDGCIYAYFLYSDLGPAAFVGLGLMLAISAAQVGCYSRLYGRMRRARAATTDVRLNATGQALSGIRTIKANAWEAPFLAATATIRAEEVRQLQAQYIVRGSFEGLIHSKYLLLSGATLLAMWA